MKRFEAETRQVEMFLEARQPWFAFGVVCVKALPVILAISLSWHAVRSDVASQFVQAVIARITVR